MLTADTRWQNFTLGFSLVAVPAGIFFVSYLITHFVIVSQPGPLFVAVKSVTANPETKAVPKPSPAPAQLPLSDYFDLPPPATIEAAPRPLITEQLQQALPPQAIALFKGLDARVALLQPQYEIIGDDVDIPWQILPALHLREGGRGLSDQVSLLNGARLGAGAGSGAVSPFMQSLFVAALRFKLAAKATGHINIAPEGNTIDELKRAFLIYNRGNALQNPNYSPYVMNYLDGAHVNMVWPPGDPVSRIYGNGHRDGNLGALTTYVHYGGPILK